MRSPPYWTISSAKRVTALGRKFEVCGKVTYPRIGKVELLWDAAAFRQTAMSPDMRARLNIKAKPEAVF